MLADGDVIELRYAIAGASILPENDIDIDPSAPRPDWGSDWPSFTEANKPTTAPTPVEAVDEKWVLPLGGGNLDVVSEPIMAGDYIYAAAADSLHKIDAATGADLAQGKLASKIDSTARMVYHQGIIVRAAFRRPPPGPDRGHLDHRLADRRPARPRRRGDPVARHAGRARRLRLRRHHQRQQRRPGVHDLREPQDGRRSLDAPGRRRLLLGRLRLGRRVPRGRRRRRSRVLLRSRHRRGPRRPVRAGRPRPHHTGDGRGPRLRGELYGVLHEARRGRGRDR